MIGRKTKTGFTLLELLIVLLIIGIFFGISYPIIANQLNGVKAGGPIAETEYTIKYFLANKDGSFNKRKIYIKFDISGNRMGVYYKKKIRLKKLKIYKYNNIKYSNGGVILEKIKSAGNIIESGVFFMEISSSYVSPPIKLYFKENGKEKTVSVNTYYN